MRKLIESTFVSLDGVISDTAPSTSTRSDPHMWGNPYWDDQHNSTNADLVADADALLLGRVTFEGMAEAWAGQSNPFADQVNALDKYVASRTLTEAPWNGTVLRDVAEDVAKLKERPGKNILKWGTGTVDRTLVEHGLVDEFHFWYFPVIVGAGQRLFEGAGFDTTHLKLADVTRFDSGIVVHVYTPR